MMTVHAHETERRSMADGAREALTSVSPARLLALGAALALVACASSPSDDYLLDKAREAYASGDLDRALRSTEEAMQRPPLESRKAEANLLLEILRKQERSAAVHAFQDFISRYAAGVDTDSPDTTPTLDACRELARRRSRTALVLEYAELPVRRDFDRGALMATYSIDAEGRPIDIRVARANSPASAWLVIDAIDEMRVARSKLRFIDPEDIPVPHCLFVPRDAWNRFPPQRFVPPR